jgi:hypothetical protein
MSKVMVLERMITTGNMGCFESTDASGHIVLILGVSQPKHYLQLQVRVWRLHDVMDFPSRRVVQQVLAV